MHDLQPQGYAPALWHRLRRPSTLVLIGAGLLAADPLRWLVGTWTDATYNPEGLLVALAVALLAAWSGSSALHRGRPDATRALWLLAGAAAVRAAGQLLRVNVLGALTLAVDVYALATLAGLAYRRRAVSPGWLAVLFALSLPLERALQRVLGYGLQQLSAAGACSTLGALDFDVACIGTRILLDGQDLLVDLPCSGARGLVLLLTLYCGACALARPGALAAARGLVLTLAAAWAANVLRLVVLAIGLARGAPVMEAPWHELTGLAALALGAVPVLMWARRARPRVESLGLALPLAARPLCDRELRGPVSRGLPFLFLLLALAIVNLPARPLDVARAMPPPVLPAALGEWTASPQPLSAAEQAYFTRYGGAAARAAYGPHGLLLVSTSAPLRHLHAPDECLRNAGHDVRYVGVRRGALPSALYRSVDADGRRWRIAVSYVASDGAWATSVAEAVWRWLRGPGGTTWTMVQRITPWDADGADLADWDHAVARALDLPAQSGAEETLHRTPT